MSEPTPYVYPPNPEPSEPTPPAEVPKPPRRQRTLLIAAGALIVLVGVGGGIALAETGGTDGHPAAAASTSQVPTTAPTSSAAKGSGKGKNGAKRHAMRATIVSESGSTWTVHNLAGETVRVTITANTKFGTKAAPAGRTTFTVGKAVVINGPRTTSGVTANRVRIAAAKPKAAGSSPTSTPSPSAPSSAPPS